MTRVDQLRERVEITLAGAGLKSYVVDESLRVDDWGGECWVRLVLNDASAVQRTEEVLRGVFGPEGVSLTVNALWSVDGEIGKPIAAIGTSGGIRAAALLDVPLRSGSSRVNVIVSVSKLAEINLEYMLGYKPALKRVAKAARDSRLSDPDVSAWNPIKENYLEVNAASANDLVRQLKQAA